HKNGRKTLRAFVARPFARDDSDEDAPLQSRWRQHRHVAAVSAMGKYRWHWGEDEDFSSPEQETHWFETVMFLESGLNPDEDKVEGHPGAAAIIEFLKHNTSPLLPPWRRSSTGWWRVKSLRATTASCSASRRPPSS